MDFTLKTYKSLINAIIKAGYSIQTFEGFIQNPKEKVVVLRHDVDRLPENALKIAKVESDFGLKASYYFRVVPFVFDESIIKECVKLGHEVSYHYEDLSLFRGDSEKAISHFQEKLALFRKLYPLKTICMHGSPLSKWDNRKIWEKYDYKDYGIIAEPYFDIDFNEVFYLTDAGRAWNNDKVNRRDRVSSPIKFNIKSTEDFVHLINSNNAPKKIMLNVHPHNWTNNMLEWYKIWLWQSIKNVLKRILINIVDQI